MVVSNLVLGGIYVIVKKTYVHTAFWCRFRSRVILKLPLHLTAVSHQLSVWRQEFSLQLTLPPLYSQLALVVVFLRLFHFNLLKFKLCFPYQIKQIEEGTKIWYLLICQMLITWICYGLDYLYHQTYHQLELLGPCHLQESQSTLYILPTKLSGRDAHTE